MATTGLRRSVYDILERTDRSNKLGRIIDIALIVIAVGQTHHAGCNVVGERGNGGDCASRTGEGHRQNTQLRGTRCPTGCGHSEVS